MTASEKPWTPEYKLRADASSEQIMSRHLALECGIGGLNAIEQVARGLAAARVTPPTWGDAERVAEIPQVSETLEAFAQDSTRDNAIGPVRAVLHFAAPSSAPPTQEPIAYRVRWTGPLREGGRDGKWRVKDPSELAGFVTQVWEVEPLFLSARSSGEDTARLDWLIDNRRWLEVAALGMPSGFPWATPVNRGSIDAARRGREGTHE